MEYPEEDLEKFKQDYYNHGEFNLEIQVTHLYRLAEFYQEKYKVTKDWTDCIKAHALYNSVGARKPESTESIDWKKRVFEIQQQYWGGKSALSFDQQQKLTASLKHELESIREQSYDEMSAADELVEVFEDMDTAENHHATFYECMRKVSQRCSENMAKFAERIISESVAIISSHKPPCGFVTVAIGSLARGEATPYSDLEYLFLVTDKSQEILEYFESLAITSYFQITNLGETKLSYMAIKELKGWFQDCSKNGFKIDGLSAKAGNIPTGNGAPSQQNHFIVTPQELADRYRTILENPTTEEATRGDLTAMLTYMKPIYSHQTMERDLLRELRNKIHNMVPNNKRLCMNEDMLRADIQKFDFRPSTALDDQGFAADVKTDFYRFPSILLYDITIITQTFTPSSWESLDELYKKGFLSPKLYQMLQFLLASALYMRLSAYLYHDSQDERISVAPTSVKHQKRQPAAQSNLKTSQRRWFVSNRIFTSICSKTLLIKHSLTINRTQKSFVVMNYPHKIDEKWFQIVALLSSGRYKESLTAVKERDGENICDNPLSVINNLPSCVNLESTLSTLVMILFRNAKYTAALLILQYMDDTKLCDTNVTHMNMSTCYLNNSNLGLAMTKLECVDKKSSPSVQNYFGPLYLQSKNYGEAEKAYIQALDYEHTQLMTGEFASDPRNVDILTSKTPEERLSRIVYKSPLVASFVSSLGIIYCELKRNKLAEAYLIKSQEMVLDLYGEGAAVELLAGVKLRLGHLYHETGQFNECIDLHKQALLIYEQIECGHKFSRHCAATLYEIGCSLYSTGKYQEAEGEFKKSLAFYRNLPKDASCRRLIAKTLYGLGQCFAASVSQFYKEITEKCLLVYDQVSEAKDNIRQIINGGLLSVYERFREAKYYFYQAQAMFQQSSQGTESIDTVNILRQTGCMYQDMGRMCNDIVKMCKDINEMDQDMRRIIKEMGRMCEDKIFYRKAEGCLKEALFICRDQSQGDHNEITADTLFFISFIYTHMERFIEAVYYCKQSLAICKIMSGGADSVEIANCLAAIGANHRYSGCPDKAVEPLSEARDMFRRLGTENELVKKIENMLLSL